MKIAVISPGNRTGVTASTLLMAYAIAYTQGRTVRVCYSGRNMSIKRYVGKEEVERDATRTISQISKLLNAHAIGPDGLGDYCTKLGTNIDLMDSWDESLTEDEVTELLTYTFSRSTTDYTFCDLAQDVEDPIAQEVLKVCDAVILVSEPSKACLSILRTMQESPYWPKNVPCMLLIAKYHDEIDSVDKMAKVAQFKKRDTCKIHFNPLVTKYCSSGQLDTVIPYIIKRDPRVLELNADLKECVQFLLNIQDVKLKWEG